MREAAGRPFSGAPGHLHDLAELLEASPKVGGFA
jgi:hypothetical protein